jgi:cytochrome c553
MDRTMLAAALMAAALTTPSLAENVAAGGELYQQVCRNCHGPEAQGLASFPKLAGQDAAYLADRLRRYRAGEFVGPNSPLMMPHASELSDADISDLSAYIAISFD